MGKIADYITKNNATVLHLIKMELLPLSVMQNFEMYQMVVAQRAIESRRMVVYENVANRCKCSVNTVRKAVREMEKEC